MTTHTDNPTDVMIQVLVNEKPVECSLGLNLEALLTKLEMPLQATAVALNDDIVARSQWGSTILNAGDRIALFQAIAGG
ncbi:sulfur carrier protein ThiS [Photobacterium indicum]|jgi:sulfur carrier protein|uniref:Thiamine biosynthesis protein ThiS n=1 Tax=Photobacterium indicum TaxID=81447 RepID=A0A2T3L636_9GAMM|nr:sulfur carrier protein ThiS [Photobacterium indicum]PSV45582.1 thiamine biosynthesis protein ThiS [Photobacterium indicum]